MNDSNRRASPAAILCHPSILALAVWAVAWAVWALASEEVLAASRVDSRAGSAAGFWVFATCVAALVAGGLAGSLLWPAGGRRQMETTSLTPLSRLLAAGTLFGGAVWLVRILVRVGGPGALLDLFLGGQSVADLKFAVFTPAQLPPITTMVHFAPAAASLLLVQRRAAGWTRLDVFLFVGLLALGGFRTLVLAERLAALGLGTSVAITWVFTAPAVSTRRLLAYAAAGAAALWFAWSAGEFSRSWLDSEGAGSNPVSVSEFRESLDYSQTRLGAYVFTAVNNGLIIVDESPGQSFPANFVPAAGRLGLLERTNTNVDLYESQLNREFTGESMPGQFYRDVRELAFVLALVCGLVFGIAWRLAWLNSAGGIVLYASTAQVLVDSYRSAYLFDIQGLAGFAAFGLVLLASVKRNRPAGHLAPQPRSGDELLREASPSVAL